MNERILISCVQLQRSLAEHRDRLRERQAELIVPPVEQQLSEEIAEVILFLADDRRSSFITGQTVVADGGALARLSTE